MHYPIQITNEIYHYLLEHSVREADHLTRLREETAALPHAAMQVSPEQGQFMALLVQLLGARRVLEVGVFTGYSSLSMALALPDDGRIVACDVSDEFTSVARRYWAEAGVEHKIDLHLRPATETLESLIAEGHGATYDFAFIDADKANYETYYEHCLTLLRPGGLVAVDNVLWNGKVAAPHSDDEDTHAIHTLNKKISDDPRVNIAMLTMSDGLFLAHKL